MTSRQNDRWNRRRSGGLIAAAIAALAIAGLGAGCDSCSSKPSAEDCEKAIDNVRRIRGLETADVGADPKAAVRSCRGNSTKETVACFIAARSEEELRKCEGEVGEEYLKQEREAEERQAKELREKEKTEADEGSEPGTAGDEGDGSD